MFLWANFEDEEVVKEMAMRMIQWLATAVLVVAGIVLVRPVLSQAAKFVPMPNATLVRIDGSRHFIMYDQPEKFDAAVEGWLK